jgi:hypothetical protein
MLHGLVVLALTVVGNVPASAEEPGLSARLECANALRPGRVLCELTLSAEQGGTLSWADAIVVHAPEFAPPLRARVTAKSPVANPAKLSIALIATRAGKGELEVLGRGVICPQAPGRSCRSVQRAVKAPVEVSGG